VIRQAETEVMPLELLTCLDSMALSTQLRTYCTIKIYNLLHKLIFLDKVYDIYVR